MNDHLNDGGQVPIFDGGFGLGRALGEFSNHNMVTELMRLDRIIESWPSFFCMFHITQD
jgi:hypothetical protein